MGKNVGTVDRVLRIIAGVVLIALAAMGTIGVWGYIGIVPLVTAFIGFCPAYRIIGLSTCSVKSSGADTPQAS